jgi:small-conductance mechanosensitive channel
MQHMVKEFVRQLRRLPESEQDRHLEEVLTSKVAVLEKAPGRPESFEERRRLVDELSTLNEARTGAQATALRMAAVEAAEQVLAAEEALKVARERRAAADVDFLSFHTMLDTQVSTVMGHLRAAAHPAVPRLLRDLRAASMNAIEAFREWQWKPMGSSTLTPPEIHSNAESIANTTAAIRRLTERAEALQYEALPAADLLKQISAIEEELRALRHIGDLGDLPSSKAARAGGTSS